MLTALPPQPPPHAHPAARPLPTSPAPRQFHSPPHLFEHVQHLGLEHRVHRLHAHCARTAHSAQHVRAQRSRDARCCQPRPPWGALMPPARSYTPSRPLQHPAQQPAAHAPRRPAIWLQRGPSQGGCRQTAALRNCASVRAPPVPDWGMAKTSTTLTVYSSTNSPSMRPMTCGVRGPHHRAPSHALSQALAAPPSGALPRALPSSSGGWKALLVPCSQGCHPPPAARPRGRA